jgi:hypothetical protein
MRVQVKPFFWSFNMAGDWMKIELELPDKPEVHAIANTLNLDPDAVVGKLIRVWQWFDKHTTDGNAYGVTYSLLDRITNVTGFGEAMMFAGWLEQNDKNLTMPKFDRHNSKSAKTRALTGKRVEKSRNAPSVTKALPEKRREENSSVSTPTGLQLLKGIDQDIAKQYLKVRGKKTLTAIALARLEAEATKANMSLEQALVMCIERGWIGFSADWEGVKNVNKEGVKIEWK